MKRRALFATPLLFLLPFAMSGCILFDDQGGSPTSPDDNEKGPDDNDDDGVALVIPAGERSPLGDWVHFV